MILYLETNFIVGAGTGRDPDVDRLIATSPSRLTIALPSICVMEAWSSFEDERTRRNRFRNLCDEQISQLRRDLTSVHATMLLSSLNQAVVHNSNLLNSVKERIVRVLSKLRSRAVFLPLSNDVLAQSLADPEMVDPTDDLILKIIVEHAAAAPNEERCLVTANKRHFGLPAIRRRLQSLGIKYFTETSSFLNWFGSQV